MFAQCPTCPVRFVAEQSTKSLKIGSLGERFPVHR
jgi:hypothetical protein